MLIVGAGGGNEIWNALLHGARTIKAVELHPELVNLTTTLALAPRSWAGSAEVEWAVGDARSYIARSRDHFDLISLGAGGAFGTSAAAVYSLNEDFLHTEEAYASYLERLDDGGVCISRGVAAAMIMPSARAAAHMRPTDQSGRTLTRWPRSTSSPIAVLEKLPSTISCPGAWCRG